MTVTEAEIAKPDHIAFMTEADLRVYESMEVEALPLEDSSNKNLTDFISVFLRTNHQKAASCQVLFFVWSALRHFAKDTNDFMTKMNERNKERNARLDALEQRCADLESERGIDGQSKASPPSTKPRHRFSGDWDRSRHYSMGDVVRHAGAFYNCKCANSSGEPISFADLWEDVTTPVGRKEAPVEQHS